jgi:hypothetical protein
MTKGMIQVSPAEAAEVIAHLGQVTKIVNTSPDGQTFVCTDAVIQCMPDDGFVILIATDAQTRPDVSVLVPAHLRRRVLDMSHA